MHAHEAQFLWNLHNRKKGGQWAGGVVKLHEMKEETRCRKAPGQTSCTATHTDAESLACVVLFQKLLWMMMLCCILYLQTATKGL